jgi:hypothetical protein
MEFLFADWLGTPVWLWLAFLGLVVALTAFDLGILHKEDREMGIGESLKLSAFYIGNRLAVRRLGVGGQGRRAPACNISPASSSRRRCRSTTSS